MDTVGEGIVTDIPEEFKAHSYPAKGQPAHTEPNLLVEWVKAKKRRVCPLIVVKEESHESAQMG